MTIRGLLAGLAIAAIILSIGTCVYQSAVKPMTMMMDASPIRQATLDAAVAEMNTRWPSVPKMQKLADRLDKDMINVYVLPPDRKIEGLHFAASARLFISQDAVDDGSIAVALVIFGEFQHSPEGGGLGEQDAQDELVVVRDMLPDELRTQYIRDLHHGGTKNE